MCLWLVVFVLAVVNVVVVDIVVVIVVVQDLKQEGKLDFSIKIVQKHSLLLLIVIHPEVFGHRLIS